tara:strand:- start:2946 stop:3509 length:564 start_codon:yes stop_codon:yes gene_type:complete
MKSKDQLRKKFIVLRQKKYFDVSNKKLLKLINFIKKKNKLKKNIFIALYYPSNFELDILKIIGNFKNSKTIFLLPKILDNSVLKFVEWNKFDILTVNKFGIPEPLDNKKKSHLPDIVLVPLLAFDCRRNRLGYGKGFYDRYLHKVKKLNKKIETIGVAFSFQRYKKIPTSNFDFKLNNIFTEKGFIK